MKDATIPKVIHYCWFGKSEKPESVKKCIASWRKFCPDYKIIEWNEDNFDLDCIPFVQQAYQKKKWAFVTDYARLKIIYENGGIYFDTDVELLRNIDKLLSLKGFMGTEDGGFINTGLGFGAVKNHPMLKKLMEDYLSLSFPEDEQEIVKITCPILTTAKFEKYGYIRNNQIKTIKGITIFPEEYFCPMKCQTYEINITKKTYSIHHYDSSWKSASHKKIRKIIQITSKLLGRERTLLIKKKILSFIKKINGGNI